METFHRFMQVISSSVVKKVMVALTGAFLVFFLCIHLAGNLLFFKSPEVFNGYAQFLLTNYFIYPIEAVLLFSILYHAITSIYVRYMSWRHARDRDYHLKRKAKGSRRNLTSILAPYTGVALFVFLVIHIWTMKFGDWSARGNDLWDWTLQMFTSLPVVILYVLAMILLTVHLVNGLGTLYESLGIAHRPWLRRIGQGFGLLLGLAFIVLPVAMYIFGGQL